MDIQFDTGSSKAFGEDSIASIETFAQIISPQLPPVLAFQLKHFESRMKLYVKFSDAGAGIAVSNYTVGVGAQPAHTRATAAWTRLANGLWTSTHQFHGEWDGVSPKVKAISGAVPANKGIPFLGWPQEISYE